MTTLAEEEPFAAVVGDCCFPTTCAKCFATSPFGNDRLMDPCESCKIVHYCGQECREKDRNDHMPECLLMKKSVPVAAVRLASRILLKVKRGPEFKTFNGRTWNSLMDNVGHSVEYRESLPEAASKMVELTKNYMGQFMPSEEEVLSAWRKCITNIFLILDTSPTMIPRGMAIYIGLSGLKHSCRPDCFLIWNGAKMVLRTVKENVKYSNELTINRIDYIACCLPQCTAYRRTVLRKKFLFHCECEECQDEKLEAERQSGLCQGCEIGWFTPDDPVCRSCKYRASAEEVEKVKKVNVEILSYLMEKSQESIFSLADTYDERKKVLSTQNSNLHALACSNIVKNINVNAKISSKYIDICLPIIRNLPRGHIRSAFHLLRLVAYLREMRPIDQLLYALGEAFEELSVSHGEHPLTTDVGTALGRLHWAFSQGLRF